MTTGALENNLDPGYCKAMDPDMALCGSPGPDETMALGDRAGHSSEFPGDNTAFECPPGHRLWPNLPPHTHTPFLGTCVAFGGNMGNKYQNRPWLW